MSCAQDVRPYSQRACYGLIALAGAGMWGVVALVFCWLAGLPL